jgi:hypothetical protein
MAALSFCLSSDLISMSSVPACFLFMPSSILLPAQSLHAYLTVCSWWKLYFRLFSRLDITVKPLLVLNILTFFPYSLALFLQICLPFCFPACSFVGCLHLVRSLIKSDKLPINARLLVITYCTRSLKTIFFSSLPLWKKNIFPPPATR